MFRLTHRSAAANKTSPSSEARSPRGEGRSASRWRNFFAKLDDSGATGVEFTIVAPPLLLLLLTIVDLGMMLTTQSLLDGAARDAARLIRTGQAQNASTPPDDLSEPPLLGHDSDNEHVDVPNRR
jgi:Flp pilus assembly protein TadG